MSKQPGTILITGGTSGLGYQCAYYLAQHYPRNQILIAARSDRDKAAASINKKLSQSNVEYLPLDLSSLASVRNFSANFASKQYPPIQALVLNAGQQFPNGISYSIDGVESAFATNHVGHILLYNLLRDRLTETARIVLVSSLTHDPTKKTGFPNAAYSSAEILAHPSAETEKNEGKQRYTTSKLCNVMWSYALHRHLATASSKHKQWAVNAFDPGLVPGTGFARDQSYIFRFLWKQILPNLLPLLRLLAGTTNIHTIEESGSALGRLAMSDEVAGVSGAYFEGKKEIKSSVESYDEKKQEDLWNWTAKFIAKDGDEFESFQNV